MRIRFGPTIQKKAGGNRELACTNQGRFFSDSREEAQKNLDSILAFNTEETMELVYGDNWKSLRVDRIPCYDNGDAIRTVWGPEGPEGLTDPEAGRIPKSVAAILVLLLTLCSGAQANVLEEEYTSQTGTVIHLVFDDSGSMKNQNKLGEAKAAFSEWLKTVPEDTKLSLTALNSGPLVPAGSGNREAVAQAVSRLQAGGGTPLARTAVSVANSISARKKEVTPYERHILVLFTDGADSNVSEEKVAETIRAISRNGIETIGIGFHGEGSYMRAAAGKYFEAGNKEELIGALSQTNSEIDQNTEVKIEPEIAALMANNPPPPAPKKKGFLQKLLWE